MLSLDDRVSADLAAGRLWKARDRLAGALRTDPTNPRVLDRLGEIYFRMGDLPQAGRLWYLSGRGGPDWEAAEAAFYDKYGRNPANLVAALSVKGEIDSYPAVVQERLRTLQARLSAEGRFWQPPAIAPTRNHPKERLISAGFAIVSLVLLTALGVGLYNIALFFVSAFRAR